MKKSTLSSNIATSIIVSIVVLVLGSNSHAAKLYKWVDKDGNISYQDQPPPENAKILKEDTIESKAQPTASKGGNTTPIIVYSVADCPACDSLIARLAKMGVPTENRALNEDPEAQRKILEQSDGVTVPTLFLGDKIITDTDASTLPEKLKEAGYVLNEETANGAEPSTPDTTTQ